MADRRGAFVTLLIVAFIFISSDPGRLPASQLRAGRTFDRVIAEEQRALQVVANSTYSEDGIAGLNDVTGFEVERGYVWDALPRVKARVRQLAEYALGDGFENALQLGRGRGGSEGWEMPLYNNITGMAHGRWVRSKFAEGIAAPQLNLSEYAGFGPWGGLVTPHAFGRNITGEEGDMRLRFHEDNPYSLSSATLGAEVSGNVTNLELDMSITDASAEYELRLLGVYFPFAGQGILTTTSEKFAGIFALPHLSLSGPMFNASRTLLNNSITRVIQRQIDRDTAKFNPWSPTVEGAPESVIPTPDCELVVYLQQRAATNPTSTYIITSPFLSFLEKELRFPTGAFLPSAPEMQFSLLIFSPDCGYVLESKGPPDYPPHQESTHLTGPKLEVLHNNTRHHILFFTAILSLQLGLLMRQLHESSTPSTRSRISSYTISMLALGDAITCAVFLLPSFFLSGLWSLLMGNAFLAFVSVMFFEMRFLFDLWVVQAPEREERRREEALVEERRMVRYRETLARLQEARRVREAAEAGSRNVSGEQNPGIAVTSDDTSSPDGNAPMNVEQRSATPEPPLGSLPLPVTAQRPIDTGASPVFFMPSDQQDLEPIIQPGQATPNGGPIGGTTVNLPRESFGSVYTKFLLLLLATIFLSLNAMSWSSGLRRIYFSSLALIYLSFWLPQINRNVQRNCRKAMNWEFVLGQSALRLLPLLYVYGYKGNIFFAEVDYGSLGLFVGWMGSQVLLLGSQEVVGPRWFVRKEWVKPAYDYHPVLREDEEGATMPIGFSQAASSFSSLGGIGPDESAPASPVTGRGESRRSGSGSYPSRSRRGSIGAKEAKERGKRIFDCAICMQDLEVPVIEAGAEGDKDTGNVTGAAAGLLARRFYMVTPCRHIFHSVCLEGWMKFRLQCPVCRESLPPL